MVLDDKRAAGMLADGVKEILKTALTQHHANMPIPAPMACLFYWQLTFEFSNSLISLGLDPKAMFSIICGCLNMHNLVRPNQESRQVEISWESLRHARLKSVTVIAKLRSMQSLDAEWFKECAKQLTYVPYTNFFRMLNTPSFSQKLGITPSTPRNITGITNSVVLQVLTLLLTPAMLLENDQQVPTILLRTPVKWRAWQNKQELDTMS